MHALRAIDELPMNECRKGEKKKGKTTNEKVKKGKRRSADQENLVPHDLESHVDDDQDDPPPELELSIGIFQLPSRRVQGDAEHPFPLHPTQPRHHPPAPDPPSRPSLSIPHAIPPKEVQQLVASRLLSCGVSPSLGEIVCQKTNRQRPRLQMSRHRKSYLFHLIRPPH